MSDNNSKITAVVVVNNSYKKVSIEIKGSIPSKKEIELTVIKEQGVTHTSIMMSVAGAKRLRTVLDAVIKASEIK